MLTPLKIQKIELSLAYTAVILASQEDSFTLYLPLASGKLLQQLVAKASSERPSSFDIILSLITGCHLRPDHILIDKENEGIFHTKIFLEKAEGVLKQIFEIDAKPSESLALAIKYQLPILIPQTLFTRLITSQSPAL